MKQTQTNKTQPQKNIYNLHTLYKTSILETYGNGHMMFSHNSEQFNYSLK